MAARLLSAKVIGCLHTHICVTEAERMWRVRVRVRVESGGGSQSGTEGEVRARIRKGASMSAQQEHCLALCS